jgi:hypothetical protein
MQRIKTIGLLLVIGLLGSCSSTSLLYNNAPWLVSSQIDDYFSTTSIQEQQLDHDIEMFFKWHRHQELPEYANAISSFNQQFADGLTRVELTGLFDRLVAARIRFTEASLQSASQFLASIDNEQLERFDREFREKIAEDRERTELSIEEQRQENYDRLLDTLEDWFGDFDEQQQSALRLVSDARPDNYAQWLDRREQRHQTLLEFLRGKPEAPVIKTYLHSRYVEALKQNRGRLQETTRCYWISAILKIDKIITPAQRQRAIRKLDDYRQDFIHLSEQKESEKRIGFER